jgi:hypothetical protein
VPAAEAADVADVDAFPALIEAVLAADALSFALEALAEAFRSLCAALVADVAAALAALDAFVSDVAAAVAEVDALPADTAAWVAASCAFEEALIALPSCATQADPSYTIKTGGTCDVSSYSAPAFNGSPLPSTLGGVS